jgi:hypothetical protein
MHNRNGLESVEINDDGGSVCLPCFADRTYTSNANHLIIALSFSWSIGLLFSSAILLSLSQLAPSDSSKKDLLSSSFYAGGAGLIASMGTGLMFFCGTKRNDSLETTKSDKLISRQPL